MAASGSVWTAVVSVGAGTIVSAAARTQQPGADPPREGRKDRATRPSSRLALIWCRLQARTVAENRLMTATPAMTEINTMPTPDQIA